MKKYLLSFIGLFLGSVLLGSVHAQIEKANIDLMGLYQSKDACHTQWEKAIAEPEEVRCFVAEPLSMHTVTQDIAKMENLEVLALGGNEVSELPEELGQCSQLEEILAAQTKIYRIPESVGKLKKLRILTLSYTPLESIPSTICDCENLQLLDLRKTAIKKLPECITEMDHLRELRVYGCLLSSKEILRLKQGLPSTHIMDTW